MHSRHLQGNGPLAEIEFWRERNATLSALHEQTKLPMVRKVVDVIREADSMIVANLQPVFTELFKLHTEASDNVRFLSTVERHFKVPCVGARLCRLGLTRGSGPYSARPPAASPLAPVPRVLLPRGPGGGSGTVCPSVSGSAPGLLDTAPCLPGASRGSLVGVAFPSKAHSVPSCDWTLL